MVQVPVLLAGGRISGSPNLMDAYLSTQSSAAQFASAMSCPSIDPLGNALVLTNAEPAVEAQLNAQFNIRRTLEQIISSSGVVTNTTPEELFRSMRGSFEAPFGSMIPSTSLSNNDVSMPVDARPSELNFLTSGSLVSSQDAIDEMEPTGLFNRIDLADADGRHCGEYRVVYHWINGEIPQQGGFEAGSEKFFMIFEALYPNPSPKLGLRGCLPVAEFWESLSSISDSAALVSKLADFYFNGVVQDGVFLPPVVNYHHYKRDSGQVRVNVFVHDTSTFPGTLENNQMWQLREFRTATRAGQILFATDTVKVNPLFELYQDSLPPSLAHIPDQFRTDFQRAFIRGVVPGLVAPELKGITSQTGIVNAIQMTDLPRFNEFQSNTGPGSGISERDSVEEGATLSAAVHSRLVQLGVAGNVTAEQVMNRAEAMSCAGCHFAANNDEIAPGIEWPSTLPDTRFVHINEKGELSNSLRQHFLVARARLLADFICNPP